MIHLINQNFLTFRSKIKWIGSGQPKKFRKEVVHLSKFTFFCWTCSMEMTHSMRSFRSPRCSVLSQVQLKRKHFSFQRSWIVTGQDPRIFERAANFDSQNTTETFFRGRFFSLDKCPELSGFPYISL